MKKSELEEAARQVRGAMLDTLNGEGEQHTFSPAFEAGMQKLRAKHFQAKRRREFYTRMAACIALVLAVGMLCMLLGQGEYGTVLYKSDSVKVTLAAPLETPVWLDLETAVLDEADVFTKNSVILKGTVDRVREAAIEYVFLDAAVTEYITILDVTVSDVVDDRSGTMPDSKTVTVGLPVSSRGMQKGVPSFAAGKSFLFLCHAATDQKNDARELAKYVDCWINHPGLLMLEQQGTEYLVNDFFRAYVPGAEPGSEICLVSCQVLEDSLKKAASKYSPTPTEP